MAQTRSRTRLPLEIFDLPVEKMRAGWYTDAYFNHARATLLEDGRHPRVVMQVFEKNHSYLGGMDEAIAILKLCSHDWDQLTVHALYDGDRVEPFEPVMHVEGDYTLFAHLETVYLGVFRRDVLEQQGGYNEEFIRAQDWELNFRIREAGGLVWFSPELKVEYRPRPSVRALAKQYRNYGRWRHVVARYHPGSINLRYLAPPAAVCAIAVGTGAGLGGLPLGFVIPAGYLAAVVLGSLPAGKGLPLKSRAWIPVALTTMHMSWGWGFLTSPRKLARKVIASRREPVPATN